jgi:fermentation-respiration switch protein FrsA (DUF1100 family)
MQLMAWSWNHRYIAPRCDDRLYRLVRPSRLPELYSAKDSIVNFHKPILIIHSSDDPVVPFQMGQKLYELANQPKYFIETKGGHVCGPRFFTDEISLQIRNMLFD